jgi:hypothetical protein
MIPLLDQASPRLRNPKQRGTPRSHLRIALKAVIVLGQAARFKYKRPFSRCLVPISPRFDGFGPRVPPSPPFEPRCSPCRRSISPCHFKSLTSPTVAVYLALRAVQIRNHLSSGTHSWAESIQVPERFISTTGSPSNSTSGSGIDSSHRRMRPPSLSHGHRLRNASPGRCPDILSRRAGIDIFTARQTPVDTLSQHVHQRRSCVLSPSAF